MKMKQKQQTKKKLRNIEAVIHMEKYRFIRMAMNPFKHRTKVK